MARRGYVQLANGFYLNRKVRRLRRTMSSAISAFVIMLSYCGDNLTDGYVDSDTAEFVLDITTQELDALQQVGLIETVDGGYVIHDYLEHNRSRQQVMDKRKRERERYSAESLPAESAQTAGRIETESGQTPEHQNTRTQKKEKEEYSSSFSKEIGVKDFGNGQDASCGISEPRPRIRMVRIRGPPPRRNTRHRRLDAPVERLVPTPRQHERHPTLETPHTHVEMPPRARSARTRQGNRHARPTSLPDGETTQQGEIMKHDEQVTMCSLEWLEHERRKAWREGYAAGWKDQECDFPPHTTENPYLETK